ncbi:hypothetical protein NQ318_022991 [Aromia moschata]|uniref:PiggyBac transposable element-derived protein domain-containing protein n=1 Tax=Aromia moschata TaxID=1265417 RepID=A0AAV8YBF4_9CUCU|nr:hypothetical protein NQ318_022991 [Aromia moschata]
MGCVDTADMLKSYYAIERKSRKWWHRLFWHFLDTSIVNAFILFKKNAMSGLVGANSLKQPLGRRSQSPQSQNQFKTQIPKELRRDQSKHMSVHSSSRRCAHCSTAKTPHRTRWSCNVCNVGLCKTTIKNCFVEFHAV